MESLAQIKNLVIQKYADNHQNRLNHIWGVVEMASYLANEYGVDVKKAQIAAYMHDYCKYDRVEEMEKLLTKDEILECQDYPFLYHAYASANNYKNLGGNDPDIFNAIYNHVFGRPNMSMLEAIIMIADYTEKNREYDNCIECRKILLSGRFNEAIVFSLEKTIEFCIKEGKKPHPRQIATLDEYKKKVNL